MHQLESYHALITAHLDLSWFSNEGKLENIIHVAFSQFVLGSVYILRADL